MNYTKYSDEELLESYTTALDYSGKADDDLVSEVNNRGGVDKLKSNIQEQNIIPNEIKRINKLVFLHYKNDPDPDKIKSLINSDILPQEKLHDLIEIAVKSIQKNYKDTSINSRTIIGCIIGVIISGLIGSVIWCYSILQTGKIYYILTAGILIISYIIIRLLTGQSKNNALVFIATFVSAFIAIPLGFWLFKILAE